MFGLCLCYCFQSISQSRRGRPINVHADSEACKSEMAEEVKKRRTPSGEETLIAKTNKQLTLIFFFKCICALYGFNKWDRQYEVCH